MNKNKNKNNVKNESNIVAQSSNGEEVVIAVTKVHNFGEEQEEVKDLASQAEALQKNMEEQKARLDKCLAELEEKQRLYNMRDKFLGVLDSLSVVSKELEEVTVFDCENVRISFFSNKYSTKADFSISNTQIIKDFVQFTEMKIAERLSDIEAKLMA